MLLGGKFLDGQYWPCGSVRGVIHTVSQNANVVLGGLTGSGLIHY